MKNPMTRKNRLKAHMLLTWIFQTKLTKKAAEEASAILPLAINTQTEAEKYLIRENLKRKANKKKK